MAARDLADFAFTQNNDLAVSLKGWFVDSGEEVNTRAGDDYIIGIIRNTVAIAGIDNRGAVTTGNGGDIFLGAGIRIRPFGNVVGLYNGGNSLIDTGDGNDFVVGAGIIFSIGSGSGIVNDASAIDTGNGRDFVIGIGNAIDLADGRNFVSNPPKGILNVGEIDTGNGGDFVIGIANGIGTEQGYGYGIYNEVGEIDTGNGEDFVIGVNTSFNPNGTNYGGRGIYNDEGEINTGDRDDFVMGININNDLNGVGIQGYGGTIDTGSGNDSIWGLGGTGISLLDTIYFDDAFIDTGSGNDSITGIGYRCGITNFGGTITTGKGSDIITGISSTNSGILNSGTIKTGKGSDTVDALQGGFGGTGTTRLGDGNDNLMGFGSGTFYGKDGTDTLTFNPGTYTIADQGNGFYLIGGVMTVKGFEAFGDGASEPDFFAAADDGFVTFA